MIEANETEREAIERMIAGAVERLDDRTEEWVPEALRVDDEGNLVVNLRILMTDISKEIERNEQATRLRVEAAAEDTAGMLADAQHEAEVEAANAAIANNEA